MKEQKLRCITCGRKAKVILHGTSYCQPCALRGLNQQRIKTEDTSPLEVQARRELLDVSHHARRVNERMESPAFRRMYADFFAGYVKDPKKVRRNQRRRSLRKARKQSKMQASSP